MEVFIKPLRKEFIMKKSLLLTLTFVAACGYVMAEEAETPVAPTETPAQEETIPTPAEDTLDMDELLSDETDAEEAK